MRVWAKLNQVRKETYFASTPLLGGDALSNFLTSSPGTLMSRLLHGAPEAAKDAEDVVSDLADPSQRMCAADEICMAGLDDVENGRDFQQATLWLDDDMEIRILNYNLGVSVEDISVQDVVDRILGVYKPGDRPDYAESYGRPWR